MRDLQQKPFYGVIKEYTHWVVLFREKQVTIGSVIIMAKDLEQKSLGDISTDDWAEFGTVCHDVESAIRMAFGAEKFNYLALMMYDPEVHFHVIPRYSQPVNFLDKEFVDPDWPDATRRIALDLDTSTLDAIQEKIRSSFPS